jgi:hypothetical protein
MGICFSYYGLLIILLYFQILLVSSSASSSVSLKAIFDFDAVQNAHYTVFSQGNIRKFLLKYKLIIPVLY